MKDELFGVKKIKLFCECMRKISIDPNSLNSAEKDYLLTTAVLLMKKYSLDKRHLIYAELAYFIVLNYSLTFEDYEPLYDFSISFGLYPISYTLTKNKLINFNSIANSLIELEIERKYRYEKIIETYEQKKTTDEMLKLDMNEKCFIAPTSFGKSHLILSHIEKFFCENKTYAIIVPTKALLMQTYRDVKKLGLKTRIIIHDEMYHEKNTSFIAVFTQERAFRLLNKNNLAFDFMYIDEAHQLLDKDQRSILLLRLIKLNKKRKTDCKIFYFSPLIADSENLTLSTGQNIFEKKIIHNIKEPRIFEFRMDKKKYMYNRFIDSFFELNNNTQNFLEYINENSGEKNFIYLYTPKKIQQFTSEYASTKNEVTNSRALDTIIENLAKYVNPSFYLINCLKKGIIYSHGKMPDTIRDYLLMKFSKVKEISTIIANKVILEGVNLPIDTLFILSGINLKHKDLINLIGRVNRLNEVFKNPVILKKLQPCIHFVNTDEYNREKGNLTNLIRELKKTSYKDQIENPLLKNFQSTGKEKKKDEIKKIIEDDKSFFSIDYSPITKLKRKLIELGLNQVYTDLDNASQIILKKINENNFEITSLMDRFKHLFIDDMDKYISDNEIKRLKNESAIKYYKMYLDNRKLSLNEKIIKEVNYFKKRIEEHNTMLFIGKSFGEITFPAESNYHEKVYVDLASKNNEELINIAIIKQKIEDDFVSYKLFSFFQLMFDYNQLTEKEYNLLIYGSNDEIDIELVKQGLPMNLVAKLIKDNQLENIFLDENGNIQGNEKFKKYKDTLDDFLKFEIDNVL